MTMPHATLAAALSAFQGEVRDPARSKKGQVRGRSDYTYVPLDDLLQAVRPTLSKHGLALSQPVSTDGDRTVLRTVLLHAASQDRMESVYPLEWKGSPQERGSELTYARRYSLESILGVAPSEEDDDASAASNRTAAPAARSAVASSSSDAPAARLTDEQVAERLKSVGLTRDEADWYAETYTKAGKVLADLPDDVLRKAVDWFLQSATVDALLGRLGEVRKEFQAAWFAKWTLLYPEPRKKDGATDEQIAKAEEASTRARREVFQAWYGVDSVHEIPIRALLKSERSLGWLKRVPPNEFETAVRGVRKAA